jgi:hypothetical protein
VCPLYSKSGKDSRVNSFPRVLLIDESIDGSSDTGTVLKAVFEPRGTLVEHYRRCSNVSASDGDFSAAVVVIDLDSESDSASDSSFGHETPCIFLGSRPASSVVDRERFLAKPFQYPELVRVIEELLENRGAA